MSEFNLRVESCLDWDDSNFKYENLGVFDASKETTLETLINGYWKYGGQEIMTTHVVKGILESINEHDAWKWGRFTIVDLSEPEYYKERFTFIVG